MTVPFIQNGESPNTLSFLIRMLDAHEDYQSFAAFAYLTISGIEEMKTSLSKTLWNNRVNRWVIGIDYGRSHPLALRKLAETKNSEVRIFDGEFVAKAEKFSPRHTYHMKTMAVLDEDKIPILQVIGSGNLSHNGLVGSYEAGCLVSYEKMPVASSEKMANEFQRIWDKATPLTNIIDQYEKLWNESTLEKFSAKKVKNPKFTNAFWIDVGYVTRNRGDLKPGNQFDLPRGTHEILGFPVVVNPEKNTTLCELSFLTENEQIVVRNMRFGNNSMEKITLPIPENFGYGAYDGKVIILIPSKKHIKLLAVELEEFFNAYSPNITELNLMNSGRRYGTLRI